MNPVKVCEGYSLTVGRSRVGWVKLNQSPTGVVPLKHVTGPVLQSRRAVICQSLNEILDISHHLRIHLAIQTAALGISGISDDLRREYSSGVSGYLHDFD
jgi:hypothetical protein